MNDTFLLSDGLIVTFVAMFTVFIILASIWGLMEIVHKITKRITIAPPIPTSPDILGESEIEVDKNREMVAILMALIYAHEEKPAKKYEVIEIKQIK
ncbi:OadG family protein [Jeotgalibaca sp. MA1X17-3]|uniref:OadG family protein n=1 Tax=Jeotgalibaca sp. MA1X17-3 TaxID=2908211 RepID=UPI001F253827|nr:OadG family protein [Jeotgalibaca sp. MA1X17-3]UJF16124.1 OadG family protein [Jeotgalibaca sp. MA1X17-3]